MFNIDDLIMEIRQEALRVVITKHIRFLEAELEVAHDYLAHMQYPPKDFTLYIQELEKDYANLKVRTENQNA